jgi:hypothetical protein
MGCKLYSIIRLQSIQLAVSLFLHPTNSHKLLVIELWLTFSQFLQESQ